MNPGDDDTEAVDTSDPILEAVTAAQRRWRAESADLGGPNTLLWHRDLPLGSIDLTVVHPAGVAKLLAGHPTRLSELVRESVALQEAHRRVSALRQKVVELREEHGLTTSFLAIGMATWQLGRAPTPPRAPVLLRECTIEPLDPGHADFALHLDQAVILNPVLAHYLRTEAGLDVEAAALAALSVRGNGFDARPTYQALEDLCRDVVPGFSISPRLVISTFPPAKLPFVAEFATSPADWAQRPLVADLARAEAGEVRPVPTEPAQVAPRTGAEARVVPVDDVQRAAQTVAASGSLVLDAPPGTGRTQVVANVVASTVLAGGTALLVAEPDAALNRLRQRLESAGLGQLVLDLGETPSRARHSAAQLLDSLEQLVQDVEQERPARPTPGDLDLDGPLALLRDHHHAMHQPRDPWGVSLSRAQNQLTELASGPHPPHSRVRLGEAAARALSPDDLPAIVADLTEAASIGAWRRGRSDDPWYGAPLADDAEATRAGEIVQRLVTGALDQARTAMADVCRRAGLPVPLNLKQWAHELALIEQAQDTLAVFTPQVYDAPLGELIAASGSGPERPGALARGRMRRQARGLLRPGRPPADLRAALTAARDQRADWEALAGRAARPATPAGWEAASDAFDQIEEDLAWLGQRLEGTPSGKDLSTTHLDLLLERLVRLDARADRLLVAARSHGLLAPVRERGLGPLVDDLAHRGVATQDVPGEVGLVFWASVHDRVSTGLEGTGDRARLDAAVEEVLAAAAARCAADRARVVEAAHERCTAAMSAHPAQVEALRQVLHSPAGGDVHAALAAAPDLVSALRPVWVGSPLLVPATVPAGCRVDLAVVLEAQALPVGRAVPALARAERVLVVGDGSGSPHHPLVISADPRAERAAAVVTPPRDLLSTAGAVWPVHRLTTDYVSSRPSGPLRAGAPPAVVSGPAVLLVVEGVEAVVETAVERSLAHPHDSTLLVTADAALADEARVELARQRGQRGVAIAVTVCPADQIAARRADHVVLALAPTATLDVARLDERGAHAAVAAGTRSLTVVADRDVHAWPEGQWWAALRSAIAAPERHEVPLTSPILGDLVLRLRAEGLVVREGYGAMPHRITLVVDDPDSPGRPLLAIDTDADPDAPLPSADSVAVRIGQLRRLGWTPVRVWTTEVFRDPAREVARLVHLARAASAERYAAAVATRRGGAHSPTEA